jgi:hypothetical protein
MAMSVDVYCCCSSTAASRGCWCFVRHCVCRELSAKDGVVVVEEGKEIEVEVRNKQKCKVNGRFTRKKNVEGTKIKRKCGDGRLLLRESERSWEKISNSRVSGVNRPNLRYSVSSATVGPNVLETSSESLWYEVSGSPCLFLGRDLLGGFLVFLLMCLERACRWP